MFSIDSIDHLVITVADVDRAVEFYEEILGMRSMALQEGRRAVRFGQQTIKLHAASELVEPTATHPVPGSANLCLVTSDPLSEVQEHLRANEVRIEEGPIGRTGTNGPITSLYLRDPDGNLIEIARYDDPADTGELVPATGAHPSA